MGKISNNEALVVYQIVKCHSMLMYHLLESIKHKRLCVLFLWLHTTMTSGNADALVPTVIVSPNWLPQIASLAHLAGLRRSGPLWSETSKMSMKIHNILLNNNSDKQSWLWIGPCHCFPKRSTPNDLSQLAVYRRKEWTPMIRNESNTMSMNTQWQWFMEPTTVGSLWLENDLHENELEFESYMGRSKKNVRVISDGIHAEIHEIWTCVAPAAPPLFHAAVNPCPQGESPWNWSCNSVNLR